MNFILDFLFPKSCLGCHRSGTYFCQDCTRALTQKELICPVCARLSIGGATHPICQRKYSLDGLWSLGAYQGALKAAIQKLKYRHVSDLSATLISLIIDYWVKFPPHFLDLVKKDRGVGWTIVPVPLHWSRRNWRGFNQSALLGQLLAKNLDITFSDCLTRTRPTTPQTKLERSARRQNIKNAFELAVSGRPLAESVLLIDDVWTTGSTLRECAYVLKRSGAKQVWALTLAR